MKKTIAAFVMSGLASASLATTISSTTVERIMIDTKYGNWAFIDTAENQESPISCDTNSTWSYVMDIGTSQGKQMYSLLLIAKTSGMPVKLAGTDACGLHADVEQLRRIELK